MDVPQFSVGDVVRVLDDMSQVNYLQDGHGGWTDDMALVGVFTDGLNNGYENNKPSFSSHHT